MKLRLQLLLENMRLAFETLQANRFRSFLTVLGIFIGTLVTVLSFQLMVPNASKLGTDQFPAPAAGQRPRHALDPHGGAVA